jgi:hypothetical protein
MENSPWLAEGDWRARGMAEHPIPTASGWRWLGAAGGLTRLDYVLDDEHQGSGAVVNPLIDGDQRPIPGSKGCQGESVAQTASVFQTLGCRQLREKRMADRKYGGITLGGIIVILGIVLIVFWSFWIGLIVTLIGLIAFGGFARGKWY